MTLFNKPARFMSLGLRKIQEDGFYFCKLIDSTKKEYISAFIFDGHGATSQDLTLTDLIKKTLQKELNNFYKKDIVTCDSLKRFFNRYDTFLALDPLTSKLKHLGACCSAVFISDQIFICSIGDTSVKVYDGDKLIYKTPLHNFTKQSEIERFKSEGKVIKGRRYKGLSVSRSLGDHDCKEIGERSLIAIPSVFQIQNDREFTFVMTTDGAVCIKDSDSILDRYKKNTVVGFLEYLRGHEFIDNVCVVVFSNIRFAKAKGTTPNRYAEFAKFIDHLFPEVDRVR